MSKLLEIKNSHKRRRFIIIGSTMLVFEIIGGFTGDLILTLGSLTFILILCGLRWREIKLDHFIVTAENEKTVAREV